MTNPQKNRKIRAKERLQASLTASETSRKRLIEKKEECSGLEKHISRMKKELVALDYYLKGGLKKKKLKTV